MSESETKYANLYDNHVDSPSAISETGLHGFWSNLPASQSVEKWQIPDTVDEYFKEHQTTNGETSSRKIVADRAIPLMRFLHSIGLDLNNKVVVDQGCGDGTLSVLTAISGATVHAADPSPKHISPLQGYIDSNDNKSDIEARDQLERISPDLVAPVPGLITTHITPAEKTPLADESADVVIFKYTLQWANDKKALDEALRVLKPGGSLIIMTTKPMDGQPNLFCRGWNAMVQELSDQGVKFNNFESPKNPNPIHHLPTLVKYMAKLGFKLANKEIYLEETGQTPEAYIEFLHKVINAQLRYCLAGTHDMTDEERNTYVAKKMRERAEQDGDKSLSTYEPTVMLRFTKKAA